MADFRFVQLSAFRNAVPLAETSPAAAAGGVLRDEAGMSAHGGLPSVVERRGGCEPAQDELPALVLHFVHALFRDDPQFRFSEFETRAEC